ncbi:hypothetical protein [Burkholderia sp. WAC0059]|uniref:hypothetical protein n=1 Tax=Burkholderia sp. WAC0059 TaxID=2066022 RepID=UPI0011AFAB82|nr:hypothetical protein [Burkholderia sp. WAC0059]
MKFKTVEYFVLNMANKPMPLLSIVVPTMGKGGNLYRCLDSIVHHAPGDFLKSAELIVFINADPVAAVNYARIESYLQKIQDRFESLKIVRAQQFELTAEESALAASGHASGEFLWIVGDARIFLPEGLAELARWVQNPTAPAVFFNTIWYNRAGVTNGRPSIHIAAGRHFMTYKQFVMHTGINFMATAMGAWVYERRFLDREKWHHIIENCGPHFSHVATLLATMGESIVHCQTTFLYINESKDYHAGDDSEWVRYSRLSNTYRFYAWTLGLVRQFNYLVSQGVYQYSDIRRSMCSEGPLLRRQVDEIYIHALAQLRYGWANQAECFKPAEFDEIIEFMSRTCPEKAIVNELIRHIYTQSQSMSDKEFMAYFSVINEANQADNLELKLASLIVDQIGDYYIRLHPKGYIASPVGDSKNFTVGYKLLDAVPRCPDVDVRQPKSVRWMILDEEGLRSFSLKKAVRNVGDLFPLDVTPVVKRSRYKAWAANIVVRLYRSRFTYRIVNLLPTEVKKKLKAVLM